MALNYEFVMHERVKVILWSRDVLSSAMEKGKKTVDCKSRHRCTTQGKEVKGGSTEYKFMGADSQRNKHGGGAPQKSKKEI